MPSLVVVAATRGDDFVEFYGRHAGPAARYARAVLGAGRRSEVDDALQDAWTKAWKAWESASPERREAWLFRIVRNCCLDRHRARTWLALPAEESLPFELDTELEGIEVSEAVALLDQLRPALRETLYLRAVEDRSYDEIAAVLGVPIGTVMSRLHAARKKLQTRTGRL